MKRIFRWLAGALCAALLVGAMPASAGRVQNGALGDANADQKVNTTDARTVLQYAAGLRELTGDAFTAADTDGNGKVNTTDARLALQYAAGMLTHFPAASANTASWTLAAADYTSGSGVSVADEQIHFTSAGFASYSTLDFGEGDPAILMLMLAAGAGADGKELEVYLDSPDGELIDVIELEDTDGVFKEFSLYVSGISGMHTLVLVLPEAAQVAVDTITYSADWMEADDAARLDAWTAAGLGLRLSFGPHNAYQGGNEAVTDPEFLAQDTAMIWSDYLDAYAHDYDPAAYDAAAVTTRAADMGAGYLLYPARGADGFSMYPTAEAPYVDACLAADLMAQTSAACEEAGLLFGVYYALADNRSGDIMTSAEQLSGIKRQLREIILDYDPAIVELDATAVDWLTDADMSSLYNFCRTLKPSLIVSCQQTGDDRFGDFVRLNGQNAEGYDAFESRFEAAAMELPEFLQTLCAVRANGGNLLLNLALSADGSLPEAAALLEDMGDWQAMYGESMDGTRPVAFPYTFADNVFFTGKDDALYALVATAPESGTLVLPALEKPVTAAHWIGSDTALTVTAADGGTAIDLSTVPTDAPVPVLVLTTDGTPTPAAADIRSGNLITDAAMLSASANEAALGNLIDDNTGNVWNAGAADAWVEVNFGKPTVFNMVRCLEGVARVSAWAVEVFDGEGWQAVAEGTTMNNDRLIAFDAQVAERVRVHVKGVSSGTGAQLKQLEIYAGERFDMYTTITDWNGYKQVNFTVNGRSSYIVYPKVQAEGNPWVWRAEFFGAFDSVDRELLNRGWCIVYHSMSELYGNATAMTYMNEFHKVATEDFDLAYRPVLFGFSRGATYSVNFAHFEPEKVGALYLDAPFTNFVGIDSATYDSMKNLIMSLYNLKTEEELQNFKEMPNDHAATVAEAGIPVVICVGLADQTVDYQKNAGVFAERYNAVGKGELLWLEKEGCDHHPHSFSDAENVNRIADFIEQKILK